MNNLQRIEIWEALAALEAVLAGVSVDREIWMLKEKIKALEEAPI